MQSGDLRHHLAAPVSSYEQCCSAREDSPHSAMFVCYISHTLQGIDFLDKKTLVTDHILCPLLYHICQTRVQCGPQTQSGRPDGFAIIIIVVVVITSAPPSAAVSYN